LDAGPHELELAVACRERAAVAIRMQEAEAAIDDRLRRAEARARERRRVQPGVRRPARMEAFRPRTVLEELHRAGRLAAGDAERVRHAVRVEPEHDSRRGGAPERAARAGRVEAAA